MTKNIRTYILLFLIFLLSIASMNADVSLKKLYDFPREIGTMAIFPTGDEEVYVWVDKPGWIKLFQDGKLKETFTITKGEGPGDINNIGNIIKKNNKLYIWDKSIRRLSVYSLDLQLQSSIKTPKLGRMANLMGVLEDGYIFEWLQTSGNKRGNIFNRKIGLVDQKITMKCLKELSGMFSVMDKGKRRHNLDKGILIGTTDRKNVYWADNREYKIYKIDLRDPANKSHLFISREVEKIKCTDEYLDMQYHLWEKPPENEDWYEIYPKYLPPLYIIAADAESDYFLVVVNTPTLIKEKKSQIDIYSKNGDYLGRVKTPITENQWIVFAPEFYFKDSVILKNNLIYLQLDDRIEVYRIVQ